MPLHDYFRSGCVLLNPVVEDKWALLRHMVASLVDAGTLSAERQEEARAAVFAREESVSTGMEQGIAVPHASLPHLSGVHAALALLPKGLDFSSLDGAPTQIVVLLLVPKEEKLLHVRTLTEIARRLGDVPFRRRLLAAGSPEAALDLWR